MARGRALDQGIHRLVGVGTPNPALPIPRVRGILEPALCLFTRARGRALGPRRAGQLPKFEVTARAVIELDVALLRRDALAELGQLSHEWKLAIVFCIDLTSLALRIADRLREFPHAGAIDFGEVGALGRLAVDSSPLCDQRMEIRIGIVSVPCNSFLRLRQTVLSGIMHDEPKFLLRDICFGPDLALPG